MRFDVLQVILRLFRVVSMSEITNQPLFVTAYLGNGSLNGLRNAQNLPVSLLFPAKDRRICQCGFFGSPVAFMSLS